MPLVLSALVLAACQLATPDGAAPEAEGLAVEAIAVTSLDAPAAVAESAVEAEAAPAEAVAEATPEATDVPEVQVAPEAPEVPKSPEQLFCEESGGLWTVAGETGANLCVSQTRDGGKSCRKKSDCEGQCLARSGTCAPYAPLFGCNEVLDKDGRQMTLCLD